MKDIAKSEGSKAQDLKDFHSFIEKQAFVKDPREQGAWDTCQSRVTGPWKKQNARHKPWCVSK